MAASNPITGLQILLATLIYGRLVCMLLATVAFALRRQRVGFAFLAMFFLTSGIMILSDNTPMLLLFSYLVGLIITLGFFLHEWLIKPQP